MTGIPCLHTYHMLSLPQTPLVRTQAPIARDDNIGPPAADRLHLHLRLPLHPPHHHHLRHVQSLYRPIRIPPLVATMSTIIPHEGERNNADMKECVDAHSTPAEESASASEGFGPLGLADFISPAVAEFLGVRSLVCFGATSKSNRLTATKEVERRKMRIAEVEVDVLRLMTSQKQTAKLSAYIDRTLYFHGEGGYDGGGFDEMYSHLEEESGEVIVRNPTRENFLAAKTMIYNGMRLIDDEIGIFHVRSATAEGSDYFDVWEDVIISDHPSHAIAFPFGTEEPGDKIDMFREERRKFFADDSRTVRGPPSVGSLFLLPGCFYFPLRGGLSRMSGDDIAEASSLAAR